MIADWRKHSRCYKILGGSEGGKGSVAEGKDGGAGDIMNGAEGGEPRSLLLLGFLVIVLGLSDLTWTPRKFLNFTFRKFCKAITHVYKGWKLRHLSHVPILRWQVFIFWIHLEPSISSNLANWFISASTLSTSFIIYYSRLTFISCGSTVLWKNELPPLFYVFRRNLQMGSRYFAFFQNLSRGFSFARIKITSSSNLTCFKSSSKPSNFNLPEISAFINLSLKCVSHT